MRQFRGRVAVVTGAASGMGLAFAHRFADEGMKVVIADIERDALQRAHQAIRAKGAEAIAVEVDVSSEADVLRLADAAHDAFGKVHVLCNNAGVATAGLFRARPWETSLADWDWVLGVNFMGVLYGVRAFVPRMLAHGEEGHVVNTASVAGLLTSANPYHVSKHGVVCLTEGLYKEFRTMGANLSASVLCPGLINTAIAEAERNRPAGLGTPLDPATMIPEARQAWEQFTAALKAGIEPAEVARQLFDGIRDDRFYIVPAQPYLQDLVRVRMQDLIEQRNPTLPRR